MSDRLTVRPTGGPVPQEGGGGWIEGAQSVPNTHYYRRAIADGSLELAEAEEADAETQLGLKETTDGD